jgi:hypothetical protein
MLLNVMKSHKNCFAVTSFFLYVTCLTFSWVLIQPPYGVSDEPAHTIKAVASAYGQFDRPQVIGQFGYGAYGYDVPEVFTSIWHSTCYNDDTRTTAACNGDFPPGKELVGASSTAGPNPPTYYVAIGWLGRVFPSQTGFYLMRFLGALLFSLALTFTFALQFSKSKSRNAWASILLLLTPAVSSFSAVINPFAHEIAAAALFWTSAILLTDSRKSNRESKQLWGALVGSAFFFSCLRPAAFLWLTVITFFVIISDPENDYCLIRFKDKIMRSILGIAFNAAVISLALSYRTQTDLVVDPTNAIAPMVGPGGNVFSNMLVSYRHLGVFFRQLFGHFGWTSFYPPFVVPVLFVTAVVMSIGVMRISTWRLRSGLAALIAFVYFGPVVLEGVRASSTGFFYQGRYVLPVAIGIPIYVWLRGEEREPNRYTLLLTQSIVGLSAGSSIFAANYVARRFVSGTNGRILWFFDAKWSPPGGVYVTLGLLVGATIGACLLGAVVVSDNDAKPQRDLVDSVQSR